MDYVERTIRQRLDNEINSVPRGFWNYNRLCMALRIIIEEKFEIKPEDIPVENMKSSISVRILKNYASVRQALGAHGFTVINVICNIYNISVEEWYLVSNIEKLYELRCKGYKFVREFFSQKFYKHVIYKLFLYGLAKEGKILNRNNIIEVSKDVFCKLGWVQICDCRDRTSYYFKILEESTGEYIYFGLSDMLCGCFPHSFQAYDFYTFPQFIKYYINYEIHVRCELKQSEFLNISNITTWSKMNFPKIHIMLKCYYNNNTNKNINDFKNLIEWEGPLYDKMMKELEYVKTHRIPFGYKDTEGNVLGSSEIKEGEINEEREKTFKS